MIRPIPTAFGTGFVSMAQLPEMATTYREENSGHFWNYHFTKDNYSWPSEPREYKKVVIDGFSPNLNKHLHVGHLRNLAIAASIIRLSPSTRPEPLHSAVALLGASQGVISTAFPKFQEWCKFLNYEPAIHYDVLQPHDFVECRLVEEGETAGCKVWDGPKEPLIVVRSNGRPTYIFYEIAFAKSVCPTHYLTGAEQKEHFEALGLDDKHLAMGLVLGKDGKKMKSRNEDSVTAEEIMQSIKDRLKETSEPDKVAWNVLAWNFLHTARAQNIKYDPDAWTDPDAPGMYVTYTCARIKSTLKGMAARLLKPEQAKIAHSGTEGYDLTNEDISLLGHAAYHQYYYDRAIELMDPAPLANYVHSLARKLGAAYHQEKIIGGRYAFQYAVAEAFYVLQKTMNQLTMFPLEKV